MLRAQQLPALNLLDAGCGPQVGKSIARNSFSQLFILAGRAL